MRAVTAPRSSSSHQGASPSDQDCGNDSPDDGAHKAAVEGFSIEEFGFLWDGIYNRTALGTFAFLLHWFAHD